MHRAIYQSMWDRQSILCQRVSQVGERTVVVVRGEVVTAGAKVEARAEAPVEAKVEVQTAARQGRFCRWGSGQLLYYQLHVC
jgi:lipoate-protein ligase B